jgi:hypothetical protein
MGKGKKTGKANRVRTVQTGTRTGDIPGFIVEFSHPARVFWFGS